MLKIKKRIFPIFFLISFLIIMSLPANYRTQDEIFTSNEIFSDLNQNSDLSPLASSDVIVLSWWNESYQYRIRFEIENTLGFSRDLPVDLWIPFDSGKAHEDSIRVVEYDENEEEWTAIPYQVWNSSVNNPDADHLGDATITFVITDFTPGTKIYYVYYDPDVTFDPTDFSGNSFTSDLSGDKVTVEWDDKLGYNYNLSLNSGKGVYQLLDNYDKNYHTDNSSAPGFMTLTEDLIGYWNFDDGTPEELTDTIPDGQGTGYNEVGNIYYDTGKYGQSAYFDGSGDYIAINSDQMEYGGGSSDLGFTIMAWVKPNVKSSERIIASWDRSEYWRFSIDGNDKVYWSTYASNIDDMRSTASITEGVWTHVTATYDPSTGDKSIYINGILDRTDSDQHADDRVLGYPLTPHYRYGFIGTGSEAETFDGGRGPSSCWDGGLDELRIYNKSLTQDEIQLAMNQAVKTADIKSAGVEEVVNGDVLSIYNVEWNPVTFTGSSTMTVTDTFWFYRSLNMWKVNRTFYWDYSMTTANNSFAAWNTLYNWDPTDGDLEFQDYYYYDNNMHEGQSNVDFPVKNYTVLHDYDSTEHRTAVGLFFTGIPEKSDFVNLTDISWKIDVDSVGNLINFIPGNQSDLNNNGGAPSDYTVTLEFWEYIQNDFNYEPAAASTYYNDMHQSLITPVVLTSQDEESLFFNLEIHLIDHDGLVVPDINVSINSVNDTGDYDEFITDSLSDSNGNTTFYQLPANNYTISLSYNPYETELELGNYTFELNQTTVDSLNSKSVSYTVNLTSVVLHFGSYPSGGEPSQPIVGAAINFAENDSSSYSFIGTEETDANGNVTFRWTNFTTGNPYIEFNCTFLGSLRQINISDFTPLDNVSIDFDDRYYEELGVQVGDFVTNMSIYDQTTNYIWGNPLDFKIDYNYTIDLAVENITGASINYKIQYRGETINDTTDTSQIGTDGEYFIHLDYVAGGTPLIAQRDYTLRITAEKNGYTPMIETINFMIENISTELIVTPAEITEYWTDNISLSVLYNNSLDESGIGSATISYSIAGYPGIYGFFSPDIGPPGNYLLELNTTVFPDSGIYTMQLICSKQNYEAQLDSIQIVIQEITTTLISEVPSLEVTWMDSFALNVFLNDTISEVGIENASVSWSLVGNPSIDGDFIGNGTSGWYSININSTELTYAGDYFLKVEALVDNYETRSIDVPIKINKIHTLINGSATSIEEIDVYITEHKMFYFDYSYRIGDIDSELYETVQNATFASFEWEFRGETTESSSGSLEYNAQIGLYELDFQTESQAVGTYVLTISLQEINYLTRVAIVTLHIKPMVFIYEFPVGIDVDTDDNLLMHTLKQGEVFPIIITLTEDLNGSTMGEATVLWQNDAGELLPFTHTGNGVYQYNLTGDVDAFIQQQTINGKIIISATDHQSFNITAQITVQMPEIFPGLPTFYFVLILGFVAVIAVSLGGYKYVQQARIPEFIKKCDKIEKDLRKNRKIDAESLVTESKEEILISMIGDDWKYFGLDFKDSIGYAGIKKKQDSSRDTEEIEEIKEPTEEFGQEEVN